MMLDVGYEHAPCVLVAILVIGHRHILGCIVSLLLRIGLAFGLIKFQAKTKRNESQRDSSTNNGEQEYATSASGGRIEIDGSDLDVQISLFGVIFGKAIGSSGALYRIQREIAGRVGGGGEEVTSDANGHCDDHDLLPESCRVKSITSVQIRRCSVGSIGLTLFSSMKRIVKAAGSNTVDAPVGRALCALTIGGIKMDARIFVGLDSDGERRDIAIDVVFKLGLSLCNASSDWSLDHPLEIEIRTPTERVVKLEQGIHLHLHHQFCPRCRLASLYLACMSRQQSKCPPVLHFLLRCRWNLSHFGGLLTVVLL